MSPPRHAATLSSLDVREPDASQGAQRCWGPYARIVAGGWAGLLALSIIIGIVVTGPLQDSALVRWDRRVPVDLERARTAAADAWSHYGSLLGDTLTVVAIAVVAGAILLLLRRWASVLTLTTALLCEVTLFMSTTIVVPRSRPDVEQMDVSPPTSSFPSGHTAAATTLALTLALIVGWHVRSSLLRGAVWLIAVVVGPLVGLSRMYRGMHHPLDVAVGLALGVGCVIVAYLAVRAWIGRSADDDHIDATNDRAATESGDDHSLEDRLAS